MESSVIGTEGETDIAVSDKVVQDALRLTVELLGRVGQYAAK